MWMQVKNNMNQNHKHKIDIVYLGDSRAKAAFIVNKFEENSKLNVLNFSIGGATPIEGYYSLKNFLKHNQVKNILISYAPFHLTKQDVFWDRTVKFSFLKNEEYEEIHSNAELFKDRYILDKNYLDYKIKTGIYAIEFFKGISSLRWRLNKKTYAELIKSKGHYYFGRNDGSSDLNDESKEKNFLPSLLINSYLQNIIKLAQENNMKIYWYTMPFNESSFRQTSENYISRFEKYINDFASDNFIVLNTLNYQNDKNFGDASHLFSGAINTTIDIKNKLDSVEFE